jgi:hypothetical protein
MRVRVLLMSLFLIALPSAAWACLNAMMLEGNEAVKQVKKAEKLLVRGKLDQARRLVNPMRYEFVDEGLDRRAQIVRATVDIRVPKARRNKYMLEGAQKTLAGFHASFKNDPVIAARFAEALAVDGRDNKRSRQMLEDLAKRDLMPDAYAYRTLARLRNSAGEGEGAKQALARCRKMTKRKAICSLEDPKSSRKRAKRAGNRPRHNKKRSLRAKAQRSLD